MKKTDTKIVLLLLISIAFAVFGISRNLSPEVPKTATVVKPVVVSEPVRAVVKTVSKAKDATEETLNKYGMTYAQGGEKVLWVAPK